MANRALDALRAAGRGVASAARRIRSVERGLGLFLLSIALFMAGLACAFAGATGAAAVLGALSVASMVDCVLTPSPLQVAERERAKGDAAPPGAPPVTQAASRPTAAPGPPSPPSAGGAPPGAR